MFRTFLDTGGWSPWQPERPPWWEVWLERVIDFLIITRVFIGETLFYFLPGVVAGASYAHLAGASYILSCFVGALISLGVAVMIEEGLAGLKRLRSRFKRKP
jgi:hypothetical protein